MQVFHSPFLKHRTRVRYIRKTHYLSTLPEQTRNQFWPIFCGYITQISLELIFMVFSCLWIFFRVKFFSFNNSIKNSRKLVYCVNHYHKNVQKSFNVKSPSFSLAKSFSSKLLKNFDFCSSAFSEIETESQTTIFGLTLWN